MRYLVILIALFALYFWALENIGDKYVIQKEVDLPPEPTPDMIDLHEGRIRVEDLKKPAYGTANESKEPIRRRVVEY